MMPKNLHGDWRNLGLILSELLRSREMHFPYIFGSLPHLASYTKVDSSKPSLTATTPYNKRL